MVFTTAYLTCAKNYQILHKRQEGIKEKRCIYRQVQFNIKSLKDVKFTDQDICLFCIDFKIFFQYIDHATLLAIMTNLGYPQDEEYLIGDIYLQSNTTFILVKHNQSKHKGAQSKVTPSIISLHFFHRTID
jgi:RNA-binding protein YlmH